MIVRYGDLGPHVNNYMTEHSRLDAIAKAHIAGTLNQLDRSRQYESAGAPELLRSLNEAWSKIRVCEKSILAKDARISELESKVTTYKVKNMALIAILTGIGWEGVKVIAAYVLHLQ